MYIQLLNPPLFWQPIGFLTATVTFLQMLYESKPKACTGQIDRHSTTTAASSKVYFSLLGGPVWSYKLDARMLVGPAQDIHRAVFKTMQNNLLILPKYLILIKYPWNKWDNDF